MAKERLNDIKIESVELKGLAGGLPQNKRRRLLKGTVALPVIMTLYSGAALARTSNLVGEADSVDSAVKRVNENGDQLLCVYPDPNEVQIHNGPYDLGLSPIASYEDNLDKKGKFIDLHHQSINCKNNGGIMISATAFASIQSIIRIT